MTDTAETVKIIRDTVAHVIRSVEKVDECSVNLLVWKRYGVNATKEQFDSVDKKTAIIDMLQSMLEMTDGLGIPPEDFKMAPQPSGS